MAFSEIELNKEQLAAVQYGLQDASGKFKSKPLLIIAGAGTGKTNTLAHRAAHLILNKVDPERILLMTFSRRSAKELVKRTKQIVHGKQKEKHKTKVNIPWMGTFHSVANRLLRYHGETIGLGPDFTIIDRSDSEDLIDILRHELHFTSSKKRFPSKSACLNIYSRCINSQKDIQLILKKEFPWCELWEQQLKQLFSLYTERKFEQLSLDYDDLLLYLFHLSDNLEVASLIRQKFDHILIDEYQDTNTLQAEILIRLFPNGEGLTVVGDDAQSIYSFRSAEIENILDFPQLFSPDAKVITLKENYRSIQPILDVSNQLLKESKIGYKKALFSQLKGKQKARLVTVQDDMEQAAYIIKKILLERESGVQLRQQAILFRSSHHSDTLEVELLRHDIPYHKYGGLKFLEAAHVKDFISIIRWTSNPKHRVSGFRILKLIPGIGPSIASKALDFLELNQFDFTAFESFIPPSSVQEFWDKLVRVLIQSQSPKLDWQKKIEICEKFYLPLLLEKYEDNQSRTGDIEQLVCISQQYQSCQAFISELTLDPPISTGDLSDSAHKDDDFLILSTVHSAKGQEWNSVFLLNVADGSFPNEYATGDDKAIEEERRLFNVAITRAKKELHLIRPLKYWLPEQAKRGDKHVYGAQSRFLSDKLCTHLEKICWLSNHHQDNEINKNSLLINDIKSRIRSMW